jgi:hypothetical protein
MRRRRVRLAAGLMTCVMLIQASPVGAVAGFHYAGESSLSTSGTYLTNGVDGYINAGSISMNSQFNHIMHWLTICSGTCASAWTQLGYYQGSVGHGTCPGPTCIQSPTVRHEFFENPQECGDYVVQDLGAPVSSNTAFFTSYVGIYQFLGDCTVKEHKFAFRVGSFTSPPVGYGWIAPYSGVAEVYTELFDGNGPETIGTAYFGLTGTHAINHNYAVHLYSYSAGTWNLWDTSIFTKTRHDDPPGYTGSEHWSAFRTTP